MTATSARGRPSRVPDGTVRLIIERHLSGLKFDAIARELTRRQVPPPTDEGPWNRWKVSHQLGTVRARQLWESWE